LINGRIATGLRAFACRPFLCLNLFRFPSRFAFICAMLLGRAVAAPLTVSDTSLCKTLNVLVQCYRCVVARIACIRKS